MHDGQQFSYSVQSDGAPMGVEFGYTEEGVIRNDLLEDFRVMPFGVGGSRLEIDYSVPTGISGASWSVSLAFRAAVDFSRPLPLAQFSAADSRYLYTPGFPPGGPEQTYAVQAVTLTPPPA